ncbi:hypothetical protein ymoll0001_5920 [Yersinia mollaretii ATCC 43969]|uniref:Uncharacterized protein n=1 Tax=Yersinia mollaretii (strain ATCC 43969 / DSM 18520 / CIP 103324 / CNY 7263 / WAIP 204) TaxID=349967 RepID=A0ABM9Y4S5_YERMW|nr:hypothetical protein ymoll0001_5920 [Yersinia mollaretii ATCC 43969]
MSAIEILPTKIYQPKSDAINLRHNQPFTRPYKKCKSPQLNSK